MGVYKCVCVYMGVSGCVYGAGGCVYGCIRMCIWASEGV